MKSLPFETCRDGKAEEAVEEKKDPLSVEK